MKATASVLLSALLAGLSIGVAAEGSDRDSTDSLSQAGSTNQAPAFSDIDANQDDIIDAHEAAEANLDEEDFQAADTDASDSVDRTEYEEFDRENGNEGWSTSN